jgi:cytochrome bd ubiquinol oxidase subunit II
MVHLNNIWFVIIAIFWVGFFVLEGFDFGVGMLHSFVGRTDVERRIAVNSIGPIWDGNEVWLVVGGAAIFAAFPSWYATMFSTFYLALLIVLVALIVRGVSFEYHRKIDSPRWRSTWRWSLTLGSLLVPFLLGTAFGDLLHGLPIDSAHNYTGTFVGLLVPFGLYTGLTVTVLSLFLGAAYLCLKTDGALHDRVARLSGRLGWVAAVVTFGWLTWIHVGLGVGFLPNPFQVLALAAVIGAAMLAEAHSEGWAFAAGSTAMAGVLGSIFFELFPRVMVSSTNSAYNLTVSNSASPSYTLKVMTVVAVVSFPVVLAYQGWSLYVFRKRLRTPVPGEMVAGPGGTGSGPGDAGPTPVEPTTPTDRATVGTTGGGSGSEGEPSA